MKKLKYYFKKAQKEKFAIGQFNFYDWSQVGAKNGLLKRGQEFEKVEVRKKIISG